MSGLSKVQAERNQRVVIELAQQPGNDVCADCKARLPRWASWNLGIFLCVQCASVHRKIGTHITKVKSLTLDSWTREQVDSMKNMGNIKSNAYYNPDERRNPPPTNMEDTERDSELEKFIRAKYEYKKFLAHPGSAAAQAEKKANGLLPPPPPKDQVPRSKTAPPPQALANKPSPPPVPANESPARMPSFAQQPPSTQFQPQPPPPQLGMRPMSSAPAFPQQPRIQLPPQMPPRPSAQPPTPSVLPPSSPVYGDMMALQTGGPLPPSVNPMVGQSMSMPPMGAAPNPFQALQQSGTPTYPSAFNTLGRSPSRSVSLPVGAPTLAMQATGINPFFAQQQQRQSMQQGALLQGTPTTGYLPTPPAMPSSFALPSANVPPINIPPVQPQATGYFPSPQSTGYLPPSPSAGFLGPQPSTSPFSAAYGSSAPSTSPFPQAYPQSSPSPFGNIQQPAFTGTPTGYGAPPTPFSQVGGGSPFPQPQQAQPQQGNLGAFASGMMPRNSTNPFQR
ncbi:ArfGap-domain-containing protein [Dacryopinax primogenitus]|uniref:ArfGap-domain-containing protein n=1 Tax=Dacryopinax primogenitus (strain DJM 731) TaxID=1858805 RepID=M5GCB0_DACPD|nr:ArfGap-domain-containing protein [Dacryopinax primogenitus]EJU01668.1 ArfGap-domain-containing protein [Dacryopinax primogenitus]